MGTLLVTLLAIYCLWFILYIEKDYVYYNDKIEYTILYKGLFTCMVSTRKDILKINTFVLMFMNRKKLLS